MLPYYRKAKKPTYLRDSDVAHAVWRIFELFRLRIVCLNEKWNKLNNFCIVIFTALTLYVDARMYVFMYTEKSILQTFSNTCNVM